MKIRFFFLAAIATLFLAGCQKPIPGHSVLAISLPDHSTIKLNMGMDSYLLLWHGDRQFIIRTEKLHSQSIDLQVVETFYTPDSTAQSTDIVKVSSNQLHVLVGNPAPLNDLHPEFTVDLIDIIEHRSELTNTCHDNVACCISGCNHQLCCSTPKGKCANESCSCAVDQTCPEKHPEPTIHAFAKLFSREKLKATIPWAKK